MKAGAPTDYPPIDGRRATVQLVGGGLLLALALCIIGWVIVRVSGARPLIAWDDSVTTWFVDHRTPTLDALTHVGSTLSDTIIAVLLLVIMAVSYTHLTLPTSDLV